MVYFPPLPPNFKTALVGAEALARIDDISKATEKIQSNEAQSPSGSDAQSSSGSDTSSDTSSGTSSNSSPRKSPRLGDHTDQASAGHDLQSELQIVEHETDELTTVLQQQTDLLKAVFATNQHREKRMQGLESEIKMLKSETTMLQSEQSKLKKKLDEHTKEVNLKHATFDQHLEELTKLHEKMVETVEKIEHFCKNSQTKQVDDHAEFTKKFRNHLQILELLLQHLNSSQNINKLYTETIQHLQVLVQVQQKKHALDEEMHKNYTALMDHLEQGGKRIDSMAASQQDKSQQITAILQEEKKTIK